MQVAGLKVPVLFEDNLTVPVGGRVPGATSETVMMHEAELPIVADELHDRIMLVEMRVTTIPAFDPVELPP
jgi:hypothetical protein